MVTEVDKWPGIRIQTGSWVANPDQKLIIFAIGRTPIDWTKFQWNRLIAFVVILHTDRMTDRATWLSDFGGGKKWWARWRVQSYTGITVNWAVQLFRLAMNYVTHPSQNVYFNQDDWSTAWLRVTAWSFLICFVMTSCCKNSRHYTCNFN